MGSYPSKWPKSEEWAPLDEQLYHSWMKAKSDKIECATSNPRVFDQRKKSRRLKCACNDQYGFLTKWRLIRCWSGKWKLKLLNPQVFITFPPSSRIWQILTLRNDLKRLETLQTISSYSIGGLAKATNIRKSEANASHGFLRWNSKTCSWRKFIFKPITLQLQVIWILLYMTVEAIQCIISRPIGML
jgi:hypothetical protein